MIKLVICDGDAAVRSDTEKKLKDKYTDKIKVMQYADAESLLAECDENKEYPDIVVMGVPSGQADGVGMAKKLQKDCPGLTVGFLPKAVEYAADGVKKEEQMMATFVSKGCILNMNVSEILYLESSKRNIRIYQKGNDITINMKLNDAQKKLPACFLRCHQSFLVNMDYVERFEKQEITLFGGKKIPVSRPRYVAAREAFLRYYEEMTIF